MALSTVTMSYQQLTVVYTYINNCENSCTSYWDEGLLSLPKLSTQYKTGQVAKH